MAGKRFGTSLFGFNKSDVNLYIENMIRDFEEKLSSKDEEITKLMNQLSNVTDKYEEIKLREEQINIEKEKISQALIRANETHDQIINDAKEKVKKEVTDLEKLAEREREKIVDIKKELKLLKDNAKNILNKYENSISSIVEENEDNNINGI